MIRLRRSLLVLSILLICSHPICGQETEEGTKNTIEAPSPDGQFAFRYTGESDSENQTYDLVDKPSGKVLMSVAESDPALVPSARFHMKVLWRPDSKAFALTATLWKRGSNVEVYVRNGSTFRHIELPELLADIPDKAKRGKSFPHVVELNAQSAKRWQKGSTVCTDALMSYDDLRHNYDRQIIDHLECYAKGQVHTNGLENFWSLLKRALKGTYVNVEPFHLFRYCDEQAFRFNEREDSDKGRFLKTIAKFAGKRLTYSKLIGQESGGYLPPTGTWQAA